MNQIKNPKFKHNACRHLLAHQVTHNLTGERGRFELSFRETKRYSSGVVC